MKVKDILAALEDADPEANVIGLWQSHYPWESPIQRVITRWETSAEYDEDDDDYVDKNDPPMSSTDVLIVLSDEQIRHGSENAWRR